MWSILLLLVVSIPLFVSCGSDDDDDVQKIESPIVGTWEISAVQLTYTLQFTQYGTVRLESVVRGTKKISTGTFEVSSGNDCIAKIYWNDQSDPEFWEIVVSGNTMTTKSVFSSSKLTWTRI